MTKKGHTKLQLMLGEALDRAPDSSDVTEVIDTMAEWFEDVLDVAGIMPVAIPALLRWQYYDDQVEDSPRIMGGK